MTLEKNYTISDIEDLPESSAASLALETLTVKGHTVYLVDFGGVFGLSCLVYKNGHHIYHANDYELHHRATSWYAGLSGDALRDHYLKRLERTLFTPEELTAPLRDYDDYTARFRYLRDCYSQLSGHVSIFGRTEDYKKYGGFKKYVSNMTYDPVGFAYYGDAGFVREHVALMERLDALVDGLKDNFEYQRSAFLFEMYNHEYGINWQADYDVLSVFGNIPYCGERDDELERYFTALHFTDTQRRAYFAARQEYFKNTEF